MEQDKERGGCVSEYAVGVCMHALGYAYSQEALSMEGRSQSSTHFKKPLLVKTALSKFTTFRLVLGGHYYLTGLIHYFSLSFHKLLLTASSALSSGLDSWGAHVCKTQEYEPRNRVLQKPKCTVR